MRSSAASTSRWPSSSGCASGGGPTTSSAAGSMGRRSARSRRSWGGSPAADSTGPAASSRFAGRDRFLTEDPANKPPPQGNRRSDQGNAGKPEHAETDDPDDEPEAD